MNKIFCVTSTNSVGCTFLDWSIHFLSGATQFYSTVEGQIQLTENPLFKSNAHGHKKNHPNGFDHVKSTVEILKKSSANLSSFYCVSLHEDKIADVIGIKNNFLTVENFNKINEYRFYDYSNILNFCSKESVPVIIVDLPRQIPYFNKIRQNEKMFFQKYSYLPIEEIDHYTNFCKVFFKESYELWTKKLQQTELWDLREFLSLNIRPYENIDIYKTIDLSFRHFYIDARDLWFNGITVLAEVLKHLKIEIDSKRLEQWIPIYYKWSQMLANQNRFSWDLDYICQAIINNYDHNLSKYKLSLLDEAIIQHCLIYKHGLTIKGWKLDKFPDNTKLLHDLLEKNTFHQVDDIYNVLIKKD